MTGKRLHEFELLDKLGEGGMGVVYEAIDHNLGRHIALKILPPERVANPTRKQRFIQEAKAASALNHPNIVTIYTIDSAEGIDYIAMELVRGNTLEEMLRKRPLRISEALRQAVQIADALAVAHAAGIVHRDLKPANIMVTSTGLVKILDFGVAKLCEHEATSEEEPTRTQRMLTEEGSVVGSAAYMSPEQAEGRKVDARSDIFAFGAVLYEMLTGKRAFRGESRIATMAAVLNKDPQPMGELTPGVPRELERIVNRCLRKDLARRSQSMAEIKIELEDLKEESDSGTISASPATSATPTSGRSARWSGSMAMVLVAAAVIAVAFFVLPRPREARSAIQEVPLTSYTGFQGHPALSPDGNQFAFAWSGGGGDVSQSQLYLSLIGKGTPLKLTNYKNQFVTSVSWSPDGQTIAFVRRPNAGAFGPGELILIPALGGLERNLGSAVGTAGWSRDGKLLYVPDSGTRGGRYPVLYVQSSNGGERRRFFDGAQPDDQGDSFPIASPDGKQLAFVRRIADSDTDIYVVNLKDGRSNGKPRRVTNVHDETRSPVWIANGKEILFAKGFYSTRTGIYRVPAAGGQPVQIDGIGANAMALAWSPKSSRLVYSRDYRDFNIWRLPLPAAGKNAGAAQRFLASTRYEESPAYSPDGKHIAFSSNRSGGRQIWVSDGDGANAVALTNFAAGIAGSPRWSPDGRTLVFDARPNGMSDIYTISADGGEPKQLTTHPSEDHVPCYSADGRWIFFASLRTGTRQLYRMPSGGGPEVQLTHKGAYSPIGSPDNRWLYYHKPIGGLSKVPIDGGEEVSVLPQRTLVGNPLNWGVSASGIYFIGQANADAAGYPIKLYRFSDGKIEGVGALTSSPMLHFGISPDEKWMLYTQSDSALNDLMLVENFQ